MTEISLPLAPGAAPFIGHAWPMLRAPLRFMESIPPGADLLRLKLSAFEAILVCSPELTREVLLRDAVFDKGGPLFDRVREFLGNGLSSCPHAVHRRHRRLVQRAFQPRRLPSYADTMVEQVRNVTAGWREGQLLDLSEAMHRLTAQITLATMFSNLSIAGGTDGIIEEFEYVLRGAYRRMLMPKGLARLAGGARYDAVCAELRGRLAAVIQAYRAQGVDRGDLLSLLVVAGDGEPASGEAVLTDAEVTDHLLTFFVGGMETCGSVLAWAFHLMARRPEVQAAFHAELDAVLGGREPRFEYLPRLTHTHRIVQEVLRLYPPAWIATRIVTADTVLGGQAIACGTTMVISPYLLQRKPELFPDPASFRPERWEGQEGGRRKDDPLFAWAGGARRCIGEGFALTETVLILALIGSRWRMDDVAGKAKPSVGAVIVPRGTRVKLAARSSA